MNKWHFPEMRSIASERAAIVKLIKGADRIEMHPKHGVFDQYVLVFDEDTDAEDRTEITVHAWNPISTMLFEAFSQQMAPDGTMSSALDQVRDAVTDYLAADLAWGEALDAYDAAPEGDVTELGDRVDDLRETTHDAAHEALSVMRQIAATDGGAEISIAQAFGFK